MRVNGEFVWGPGDDSRTDFTVQHFKSFARRMYRGYMGQLADTNAFDAQLRDAITVMQDKLTAAGALTLKPGHRGTLDLDTEYASGFKVRPPPEPVCVMVSIGGAGSTWNQGYPFDIGETLDRSKCWHQPIGFDTSPVPMRKGVKTAVDEYVRQLWMPRGARGLNCTTLRHGGIFYSMGALGGMAVLDRILHGDLEMFKPTFIGAATFGNPRRQAGHSFPGCMNSSGEGIATPTDHDLPDSVWDFAASKEMPGSGGDDLYTKMGDDENARTTKNMRAVWDIINTGNPLTLTAAVALLLLHPSFSGGWDAAAAAIKALDFFVVKQTGPHVRYQFTRPIANDSRDCWELARAHIADLVARVPRAA